MTEAKKIILIVEDEVFLLRTLTKHLEELNFIVQTATNGQEGLTAITKQPPDLILTDLVMPKMNGFDFLAELKKTPQAKGVPIIVITNLASTRDEERCREMGISDYFTKSDTPLIKIEGIIKKYLG